jgi:hypothetical protein
MEQKFVTFDEALETLGITSERLNQLRDDNVLRAYRDGASWKFRADEIERMASDGVPEPAPPSDISLAQPKDLVDAEPLADLDLEEELTLADDDDALSLSGSDLQLDTSDLGGADDPGGSELELESELDLDIESDQEDTVTTGASDPALDVHGEAIEEPSDPSDSILLSDETLGEAAPAPPSTIIGRSQQSSKDDDLELVLDDDQDGQGSDVRLSSGASDVLSSGIAGSGVLDDLERESGATSAFEDLEELEIDLAAESSRILTPEDVEQVKAQDAAKKAAAPLQGDSDLTLDDGLAGDDEGTDPIPAELDTGEAKAKQSDSGPTSDLELATDEDDFVLSDAGGSDITLDSGDSGINLVSPSDSGLALDDIPLEMGGSAILDSLSLGGKSDADFSLIASDVDLTSQQQAKLQTDDDFQLTPLGDGDDGGDSSSQVIALEEGIEELAAGDAGIMGDDMFAEADVGEGMLSEDFGGEGQDDFGVSPVPVGATAARTEGDYSVMNILGLGSCLALLTFCGVLMLDMVRNIWSWDSNLALNDSMLNSLLGLFGLQ